MLRSIPLGRPFGVPVFIHPTFLLIPAWVLLTAPPAGTATVLMLLAWVLAVFGCVLLHELGHALMARRFGVPTRDITLYPIGGVARLERMSQRPGEEVAIALAGPAVNVAIAILLTPAALFGFLTLRSHLLGLTSNLAPLGIALQFLTLLWVSNVFLVLFNLLPCFPMDGGRVLRALLAMKLGTLRATEIAAGLGLVLAAGIAFLAIYNGNPLTVILAVFLVLAGQAELRGVRAREARRQPCVVQPLVAPPTPPLVLGESGPAPDALTPDYSGLTWHKESHVWVLWREGRPVAVWGPAE